MTLYGKFEWQGWILGWGMQYTLCTHSVQNIVIYYKSGDVAATSPIRCKRVTFSALVRGMIDSHRDFFERCQKWVWSQDVIVCACTISTILMCTVP